MLLQRGISTFDDATLSELIYGYPNVVIVNDFITETVDPLGLNESNLLESHTDYVLNWATEYHQRYSGKDTADNEVTDITDADGDIKVSHLITKD